MSALCLVLHAHQPDVRGDALAETWMRDALRDCYAPLLELFRRKKPRLSMSVSLPLLRQGFPAFSDISSVQWMTTSESHAILPLMRDDTARLRQLCRGRSLFSAYTNVTPQGFWLPELAYAPGLSTLIFDAGYTHTVVNVGSGVGCFTRDAQFAERIWSRDSGIPGHPLYRDFHKTDADGRKRWRITSRHSDEKEPYDSEAARNQAHLDAEIIASEINARTEPLIAAFDAELFGHWWFEGPIFLEALFDRVKLVALQDLPLPRGGEPPQGSWGEHGDLSTWLQPSNAWMLPELHAAQSYTQLGNAACEALALAECSDWAYMLARGHFESLATRQFRDALKRFYGLVPQ